MPKMRTPQIPVITHNKTIDKIIYNAHQDPFIYIFIFLVILWGIMKIILIFKPNKK